MIYEDEIYAIGKHVVNNISLDYSCRFGSDIIRHDPDEAKRRIDTWIHRLERIKELIGQYKEDRTDDNGWM